MSTDRRQDDSISPASRILVTGAPRSGTTVLGRLMALSSSVAYLWEPFNQRYREGIPDYYPYCGPASPLEKTTFYDRLIEQTLDMRNLNPHIEFFDRDSAFVRLGKRLGVNRTLLHFRRVQFEHLVRRPSSILWKDPISIFLSRHLIERHAFRAVITVRHPAAVAESRRKLNWRFDFDCWRRQTDFYADHFGLIDVQLSGEDAVSLAVEAAYHWITCYRFAAQLAHDFPEQTLLIRHEDLSLRPAETITAVGNFLQLPIDPVTLQAAQELTRGETLDMSTHHMAVVESRDAAALVDRWKKTIAPQDFATVQRIAGECARTWYPEDADWNIAA